MTPVTGCLIYVEFCFVCVVPPLFMLSRESASPQRIKEAHRRILMLNHPDTGGSTYIASKINEVSESMIMMWSMAYLSY